MRSRIIVLALAVAGLAALVAPPLASAAPRSDKGLTINSTPNPILAGQGVIIYGALNGSDIAHRPIVLLHRVNPNAHFSIISVTRTNADGFYEFTRAEGVVISNRSWFVRGPGNTHSATIHERVAPLVTLNESATSGLTAHKILFSGSISPDHAFQRVLLQAQDASAGNGWHTIAAGRTGRGSNFAIAHRFLAAGDYTLRAYFPATPRNTAGSSDSVTLSIQQAQVPSFTIGSSDQIVSEGNPVTVSGVLDRAGTTTPLASTEVTLYGRTAQGPLEALATTVTAGNGGYSFTETPVYNTMYRVGVTLEPRRISARLFEGVRDVLTARPSSTSSSVGSTVTVTGTVSPAKIGHTILLQLLGPGGHWQNVAMGTVGAGSAYSLSYTFGRTGVTELRARIFGGPENVGGASAPMSITVSGDAALS
jgi:hypothetical protein